MALVFLLMLTQFIKFKMPIRCLKRNISRFRAGQDAVRTIVFIKRFKDNDLIPWIDIALSAAIMASWHTVTVMSVSGLHFIRLYLRAFSLMTFLSIPSPKVTGYWLYPHWSPERRLSLSSPDSQNRENLWQVQSPGCIADPGHLPDTDSVNLS